MSVNDDGVDGPALAPVAAAVGGGGVDEGLVEVPVAVAGVGSHVAEDDADGAGGEANDAVGDGSSASSSSSSSSAGAGTLTLGSAATAAVGDKRDEGDGAGYDALDDDVAASGVATPLLAPRVARPPFVPTAGSSAPPPSSGRRGVGLPDSSVVPLALRVLLLVCGGVAPLRDGGFVGLRVLRRVWTAVFALLGAAYITLQAYETIVTVTQATSAAGRVVLVDDILLSILGFGAGVIQFCLAPHWYEQDVLPQLSALLGPQAMEPARVRRRLHWVVFISVVFGLSFLLCAYALIVPPLAQGLPPPLKPAAWFVYVALAPAAWTLAVPIVALFMCTCIGAEFELRAIALRTARGAATATATAVAVAVGGHERGGGGGGSSSSETFAAALRERAAMERSLIPVSIRLHGRAFPLMNTRSKSPQRSRTMMSSPHYG